MSERQLLTLGFITALSSAVIGFYIALNGRPLVIPIGLLGLLIGFLYSYPHPRLGLKFNALGEIVVFIALGPLMFLGAFYASTGFMDLRAVIASVPLGILITLVLFANNMRDVEFDRRAGILTLPMILGSSRSRVTYVTLITLALVYTLVEILAGVLPLTSLIILALIPQISSLVKITYKDPLPVDFDPKTARLIASYTAPLVILLITTIIISGI